jgi:glycosyltransferase involved in cell wall biosynthesis
VLITPARNEGKFIEGIIKSVVSQTIAPLKWVIVNDGSTDDTAEIVCRYADRYTWIELRDSNIDHAKRVYSAKAHAVNWAYASMKDMDFDVVANLDADVLLEADYFEFIIGKLCEHPEIGVIGTPQLQPNYDPVTDGFFNEKDVFGACQIFRRECFEQIGGYLPLWGGVDWAAVRMARMYGWTTRIFFEKPFLHNRIMGATETNRLIARFKYGVKDYYLGNHPMWEIFRIVFQLTRKPYVIGGISLLLGYLWALATRMKIDIPEDLIRFHRREEMERLKAAFSQFLPAAISSP